MLGISLKFYLDAITSLQILVVNKLNVPLGIWRVKIITGTLPFATKIYSLNLIKLNTYAIAVSDRIKCTKPGC